MDKNRKVLRNKIVTFVIIVKGTPTFQNIKYHISFRIKVNEIIENGSFEASNFSLRIYLVEMNAIAC